MARWVIENRITEVDKLREFDIAGYYYSAEQSNAKEWVFLRNEGDA
ncbi:MAG TPA: hypothetical protein DE179_02755 [Oceanospirillaceae bacterium]|nr:hypothetical protein [Oceanospirillaceae bacterium]